MRTLGRAWFAFVLLIMTACGGSNSTPLPTGQLSGNWQLSLFQEYPAPRTALSVSGFLTESNDALTGSVEGPTIVNSSGTVTCGGTAQVTGTINGQSVAFTENLGGTTYSFSGTISSNNQSMSGDYQAQGGACFTSATTGTWNAFLIPPLNGNFTGTFTGSNYMTLLTGVSPAPPIVVSGSLAQSSNGGASSASLTGTITAVGYPCFSTASVSGTISGQSMYLDLFDYNGVPIGTLGQPSGAAGTPGSPLMVVVSSGAVSLSGTGTGGLFLGDFLGSGNVVGPCPPIIGGNPPTTTTSDAASVMLNVH